jgi:recombination protein RecA
MARRKVTRDPMEAVLNNLAKSIGYKDKDPLIYKFGDVETQGIEAISFGYPEIDEASAIGGIQRGKLVEIFGLPSSGKSFLCLKLIATAQSEGLKCLLVDAEQSFDPAWAKRNGVDVDELYLVNASICAEDYMDLIDGACKSGAFGLVVVDSTAALIPEKEMDGSVGDQDYALLARIMSKGCKKIVPSCTKGNTACVFINQVRANIKDAGKRGADQYVTPGGNALDFYSHQRILVYPGGMIRVVGEDGNKVSIGKKSYVTFVKNKLGNPDKKCEIQIVFDETAMNPIVKLVTLSKAYKVFNIKLGEYGILTELVDEKYVKANKIKTKFINTKATSFGDLAHWVLSNGYIEDVLDAMKEIVENEEDDDKLKLIDADIYKLIELDEAEEFANQDLWKSPLGDYSVPTDPDVAKGNDGNDDAEDESNDEKALEKLSGLAKNGKGDTLEEELDLNLD